MKLFNKLSSTVENKESYFPAHLSCKFYTHYKYPGPRDCFLPLRGSKLESDPWLPCYRPQSWVGPQAGTGAPHRKFRFFPWAVCQEHRLHALLTVFPGTLASRLPPRLLSPLANARPLSPPPAPSPSSLTCSRKNILTWHVPPAMNYIQKEQRGGRWGP